MASASFTYNCATLNGCPAGEFGGAAAVGSHAGEEVGGDGDVAGLGELVGHAARPVGEALIVVNDDDGGGFSFHLGVGDEGGDDALVMGNLDVFVVAGGFFEAGLGPVLGGGGGGERAERGEEERA